MSCKCMVIILNLPVIQQHSLVRWAGVISDRSLPSQHRASTEPDPPWHEWGFPPVVQPRDRYVDLLIRLTAHSTVSRPLGSTGGFNAEARDRDIPFTAKDEPATLPRVTELIIITELSPWCTIIRNERGVTMSDVCSTIWKE